MGRQPGSPRGRYEDAPHAGAKFKAVLPIGPPTQRRRLIETTLSDRLHRPPQRQDG